MSKRLTKIANGDPCPEDRCNGSVHWSVSSDMFVCISCNSKYSEWFGDFEPEPVKPHEKPICYIAGALNDMSCDYIKNVRKMIVWAEKISDLGYAVFVPGLDLLWGIATGNLDYNRAFNNSQPFLAKADIVFVCPGWANSKGTKRELDTAALLGVPIYYGDAGYKHLHALHEWDVYASRGKPSDEESARDRRRPKDATIAGELDDEALAELKRRIAEGPYRTTGDNTTSTPGEPRKPYMSADEGTCDDRIGPNEVLPASEYAPDTRTQCMSDFLSGTAQNKKLKFIEEANNHNIISYLKHDPHPDYYVVSVIPMSRATKLDPFGEGPRFHTYIWELKDA